MAGDYADELATWGAALTANADLLIYGCDFGDDGAALAMLADATGADVAASTDATCAEWRGGDWDLEARSGSIEATTLAAREWDGLLATPVLDTSPALTYTAAEDAPAPANGTAVGVPVSTYTGGISDADPNAAKGIAVTGNAPAQGVWWYTTNGGTTWTQIGTVSDSNALLLTNTGESRVYFQPNADYNGTIADALTIRAWDRTQGSNGGRFNIAASGTGGTTPIDAGAANRLEQRRTGVVVIHARPSSPLLQWFRAIGRIWRAERPV